MRARRNADADIVSLEFLLARKARHRQFGLGQRQRGQIGIGAHVGDDAGDDGGLPRLVLADRGVLGQHMGHLVAQHRGQFRGIAGQRDQATGHIKLAGRQRERVHRAGIEDRDLVGLVGTIGGRDQPIDGLADQRFELRIVIGAAIGRQNSLMLALGGGRLGNSMIGLDTGSASPANWRSGTGRCRRSRPARRSRTAERAQPKGGGSSWSCAVPHTLTPSSLDLTRANSRPAIQSAPPGAPQFVVRRAPRSSRGHESVDFRGT